MKELLPCLQTVSYASSWASAMAISELDERQGPYFRQLLQKDLDYLSQEHVLKNTTLQKTMVFLDWSKVAVLSPWSADLTIQGEVHSCMTPSCLSWQCYVWYRMQM